ncbi:hypothetical protein E8E14_013938 [Neopestalotiopsis sp. 37M]|nr:hypothetical protein E8E14_013938 [Neopestalotiopsis sp. 37M]
MSDGRHAWDLPRPPRRQHTGLRDPARVSHVARDYTVGWLCALHTELAASKAMLDVVHDTTFLVASQNDSNTYILGSIGAHNVVMACLPADAYGTNSAANVASNMLRTFPSLQIRLMVGVGAGVPSRTRDIRLGDVAVSTKVWQYDLGKTVQDGRVQRTNVLWKPPADIMTAVQVLKAKHEAEISMISEFGAFRTGCFSVGMIMSQEILIVREQSCDPAKIITRYDRNSERPAIHYGCIASGNQVMKHAATRDTVASEYDVICFEMEAAGLMDSFHCLVIRGICDYADSHKNKKWQEYAAATAAGYAKELLSVVATNKNREETPAELQHIEKAQRRTQLTNSLAFPEMHSRQINIKDPLATTCEWVLKHRDYIDWTDPIHFAKHRGFWWIKGKPGAGKSTLMKFLLAKVEEVNTNPEDIILPFFFNARGSLLEKSVLGMYRTLLHLLLTGIPTLQEVFDGPIFGASVTHQDYNWTIPMLKNILSEVITKLGSRRLTCLVDALDECRQEEVQEMINTFEELGSRALESGTKIFVCFSSRHYPSVHMQYGRELALESQIGHSRDLKKFVRKSLAQAGTGNYVEEITSQILQKANGVFVWVSLVVEIVRREFQNGRIFAVRKCLQELPPRLKDLFKHIITQDGNNLNDLLLCIQWLLFSNRLLEPSEFYFALVSGLDPDPRSIGPGANDLISGEDYGRFVISSSKGLAQVTEATPRTVQFIHESVRDFFLKENGLQEIWPQLGPNVDSLAHDRLARCCLVYLEANARTALLSGYRVQMFAARFPFLGYASKHVLAHADAAGLQVSQSDFLNLFNYSEWRDLRDRYPRREPIMEEDFRDSLLVCAAERNWVQIIRTELARRPPGDIRAGPERYALIAAWKKGNQWAFNALLQEDPYFWMERSRLEQVKLIYTDEFKMPLMIDDLDPLEFMVEEGHVEFAAHVVNARLVHHSSMTLRALQDERRILGGLLLRKPEVNSRYCDDNNWSALDWAAELGFEEITDFIIQNPIFSSYASDDLADAISAAIVGGQSHIVRQILRTGSIADIESATRGAPLVEACNLANGEIATIMIESGADVNRPDEHGETPLSAACQNELEDVVLLLLERGCDVKTVDKFGSSPLLHAVRAMATPIVRLLIDADADVNRQDCYGVTALLAACEPETRDADETMVEMLLTAGASINHKDAYGNTALMRAVASGSREIAKILIGAGANVDVDNYDGDTALSLYMITILEDEPTSWLTEAQEGYLSFVKLLLDQGADPRCHFEGWTALTLAVEDGQDLVVQLLHDYGADMNARDGNGRTPLELAIDQGHNTIVKLLLDYGADMNARDGNGQTPLELAIGKGHNTIVKLLLDYGADMNAGDENGQTPLELAIGKGHNTIVKLLFDYGVDMHARHGYGWTPLELAVDGGHSTVVKLLLDYGVDMNARDEDGLTPIAQARRAGQTDIVSLLLEHGVQIDESDADRDTSALDEEEWETESNESDSEVIS